MKRTLRYNYLDSLDYSVSILYLAFFCSIVHIVYLYISSYIIWTLIGISSSIVLLFFICGSKIIYSFLTRTLKSLKLIRAIMLVNSFIFFYSSSMGLVIIIKYVFPDYYIALLTPILITSFLFFSTSIGIHRPLILKYNNRRNIIE